MESNLDVPVTFTIDALTVDFETEIDSMAVPFSADIGTLVPAIPSNYGKITWNGSTLSVT